MPKLIGLKIGPIIFEVNYYEEYLIPDGKFPRDLPCHALWYYYTVAMQQYNRAKKNLVYEDELSQIFNINRAKNLLQSTSNMYGTPILDMIKYWPLMEEQRIMLGGGDTLPSEFKFQFSVN